MLHDLLLLLRFLRLRLKRHFRHVLCLPQHTPQPAPKTPVPAPEPPVAAATEPEPPPPPKTPSPEQQVQQRMSLLEERFRAKQDEREARHLKWQQRRASDSTDLREELTAPEPESAPEPLEPPPPPPPPADYSNYRLPDAGLLTLEQPPHHDNAQHIEQQKQAIQTTLDSFCIDADVTGHIRGPRVTLFKISVARGVKVATVTAIINDFRMALAASSLRILAPMPGHDYIGIEVPNRTADLVRARTSIESRDFTTSKALLPVIVGRSIEGIDVLFDLARAPHLLVAGSTGSGKSVCLNNIIISLVYRFSPEQLKLILVDPKVVEMTPYNALPHLLVPVITEVKLVVLALKWLIEEMHRRYAMLAKTGLRNIESFNARPHAEPPPLDDEGKPLPDKLPFIVVIIDELADIMLSERTEVENALARIAQLSRAVGIHCILATQRPSVNVITGVIKANVPSRIAFQVPSQVDSRTIIDTKGAEALLGRGDMLFKAADALRTQRLQSPLLTDDEIAAVVRHCSSQLATQPAPTFDLIQSVSDTVANDDDDHDPASSDQDGEALLRAATEIIIRDQKASISYIQRRLRIGYNRAATIIEELEQRGVVGPQIGSMPREILVDSLSGIFDEDCD